MATDNLSHTKFGITQFQAGKRSITKNTLQQRRCVIFCITPNPEHSMRLCSANQKHFRVVSALDAKVFRPEE